MRARLLEKMFGQMRLIGFHRGVECFIGLNLAVVDSIFQGLGVLERWRNICQVFPLSRWPDGSV